MVTSRPPMPEREFVCPDCGTQHLSVWCEGFSVHEDLLEDLRAATDEQERRHLQARVDRYGPRWVAPSLGPCSACKGGDEERGKSTIDLGLVNAGFTPEQIGWRFETMAYAAPNEADEALQDRLLDMDPCTFGVTEANHRAVDALARWDPRTRGVPKFLALCGTPGTGKSTLMSMIARRFLEPDHWTTKELTVKRAGSSADLERYRQIGRGFAYAVRRALPVKYVHMREILDHQRQREWKGLPQVVNKLARFRGVLFLDEWAGPDEPHRVEIQAVEDLVDVRSTRRLPMVVASNRPVGAFTGDAPIYGDRVADRMKPTRKGRGRCVYLALVGSSWR